MSTVDKPVGIPAALVEAAARAWFEHEAEVGEIDEEEFGLLPEHDRDRYRDSARRALAAALAVCKVREEWGYRSLWNQAPHLRDNLLGAPDGDRDSWGSSEQAVRYTVGHAGQVPRALIRRLVITTPTVVEADQ